MKKYICMFYILAMVLISTGCAKSNYSKIDWVDFVKINDVQYLRNDNNEAITTEFIDHKIDNIKFNVGNNVHDSEYKPKNGDSAFLKEGTELYKIKGYSENFRIAAKVDNEYRIYEAFDNPNAQKIKDILDIEDKVTYIGINSEKDGKTELGAIKDNEKIKLVVDRILNSEIKENSNEEGIRYFIDFHLNDGTTIIKTLNIETGNFDNKTAMSEDFIKELRSIIGEEVFDINFFNENLDQLGYKYNENNCEGQSLLSVNPINLRINEEQILIYQYNNKTDMEKDASTISSDGTAVGYGEVCWASEPHFYKKGSIIVEYVGKNSKILTSIREIMGIQFAGQ